MLVRSSKILLQTLAALFVGLALLGLAAVWQLARGPIGLGFLTPYIEQALNPPEGGTQVRLRDTVLAWAGERRTLDLRAIGLELTDEQGRPLARVPEMSVRFSGRALLRGLVAPVVLEISGPRLRLALNEGAPELSGATESGFDGQTLSFLTQLLQPPDPTSASGYLERVTVFDARIDVLDATRGERWSMSDMDVVLTRDSAGIRADMRITVDAGGSRGHFNATGRRAPYGRTTVRLSFNGLEPQLLANIEPQLGDLTRLDSLLAGVIDMTLDEGFIPRGSRFNLRAGAGQVAIPELYAEPVAVAGATATGSIAGDFSTVTLDGVTVDLGGPKVSLEGSLSRFDERFAVVLDGVARDVPVDELATLWPVGLGTGAYRWVAGNLQDGLVSEATLRLVGEFPVDEPAALTLSELGGDIAFSGVTVHYLRPMQPVLNALGTARYDATKFVIDVTGGGLRDLALEQATVELVNLDDGQPRADIELTVAGPVTDALAVLDMQPLGYATALGIDPTELSGQQRTTTTFRIPLRSGLTLDDIGVAAAASVSTFAMTGGLFGQPLQDGELSLEVDKRQLTAWGNLSIGDVPVEARWIERFADDGGFQTRYEVSGILDQQSLASFGLDLAPVLTGTIGAGVTYAIFPDGNAVGAAELDLAAAEIAVPAIDLRKPSGIAARGELSFVVAGDQITDIPSFEFTSTDLVASGAVAFEPAPGTTAAAGGTSSRVGFTRLAFGDNELFGSVAFLPSGALDIRLGGQRLDVRNLVGDLAAGTGEPNQDPSARNNPPFRLTIDSTAPIAEVRLGEQTRALDVSGRLVHNGLMVRSADLSGRLQGAGDLALTLTDRGTNREFVIKATDAGAVLTALDWTEAVSGGALEVEGQVHDTEPDAPMVGRALITDFQMIRAPVLGRLLSLASLRGIADTLSGEGITFRRLEVPFVMTDEAIELSDIKVRGSQLGILADGRIDRAEDTIDLQGEIAPAYTLNSLLGRVPLLGDALTGGGDGVFAATYKVSGPLDEPRISVNPLSVLTPGFTRKILGGFGSGDPPDEEEVDTTFPVDEPFEN